MIVGMIPMSFSNTQNAPLGRAVIGGLIVATFTTLLFIPNVFAIMHRNSKQPNQRAAEQSGESAQETPA
jgi:Cu/Ag efflux pump CusA